MNYNIIKSGSKGNAIIVEDKILLDCGVPYKVIKPYLKDVKIIFISHIHTDHLNKSTIKKIAFEKPNIKFLVGDYLVNVLVSLGVQHKNIITIKNNKMYNIGLCKVMLQPLIHDVDNRCLHLHYKKNKLIYIVDTGYIPENIIAKDYNLYLIEANYGTDEELDVKIKEAEEKGEFTHLKRVKKTHLSELQAINWLDNNLGENSVYEFIHKHIEEEIENEKEVE